MHLGLIIQVVGRDKERTMQFQPVLTSAQEIDDIKCLDNNQLHPSRPNFTSGSTTISIDKVRDLDRFLAIVEYGHCQQN